VVARVVDLFFAALGNNEAVGKEDGPAAEPEHMRDTYEIEFFTGK